MPLSASILAYQDCQKAFERAIDTEKGVKMTFRTVKAARMFAFRCNQFRKLDRLENKKIYPEEAHTLHGRSVFDTIRVRVEPTDSERGLVYFEKVTLEAVETEDIK